MKKILVIGACGQIGVELVAALREKHGSENVVASDIRDEHSLLRGTGPFAKLDVLDINVLREFIKKEKVAEVHLLAALISAVG